MTTRQLVLADVLSWQTQFGAKTNLFLTVGNVPARKRVSERAFKEALDELLSEGKLTSVINDEGESRIRLNPEKMDAVLTELESRPWYSRPGIVVVLSVVAVLVIVAGLYFGLR